MGRDHRQEGRSGEQMTAGPSSGPARGSDLLGTAGILALAWATLGLLALIAAAIERPLAPHRPAPTTLRVAEILGLDAPALRPSGTAGRSLFLMNPAVDLRFAPGEPQSLPRAARPPWTASRRDD
jgi:hypothetical protein